MTTKLCHITEMPGSAPDRGATAFLNALLFVIFDLQMLFPYLDIDSITNLHTTSHQFSCLTYDVPIFEAVHSTAFYLLTKGVFRNIHTLILDHRTFRTREQALQLPAKPRKCYYDRAFPSLFSARLHQLLDVPDKADGYLSHVRTLYIRGFHVTPIDTDFPRFLSILVISPNFQNLRVERADLPMPIIQSALRADARLDVLDMHSSACQALDLIEVVSIAPQLPRVLRLSRIHATQINLRVITSLFAILTKGRGKVEFLGLCIVDLWDHLPHSVPPMLMIIGQNHTLRRLHLYLGNVTESRRDVVRHIIRQEGCRVCLCKTYHEHHDDTSL